jgi:TRAP-type C4-dicarboxylate transport system substrate-binding protein
MRRSTFLSCLASLALTTGTFSALAQQPAPTVIKLGWATADSQQDPSAIGAHAFIMVVGFMEAGFRNMVNNRKPVQSPKEVAGVKYRAMQNPVFIDMFNALGGSAVPMAWGETFTAVQQGAIDGLELPLSFIDSLKVYEVTKYLSLTNHTYTCLELLASNRTLSKLSPEQRKLVLDAGKLAVEQQRKSSSEQTRQMVGVLKGKGMQVNEVEDPAAFRKAVAPMYEKFKAGNGADLLTAALEEAR